MAQEFMGPWERPSKVTLQGKYCRIEPLAEKHIPDLWEVQNCPDADERYSYLITVPPARTEESHAEFIRNLIDAQDPLVFAIVDCKTKNVVGRYNLMRIFPEHGSIEVGGVLFGPKMSKSRLASEAIYLLACYVFDELKYRRFEWKCHAANEASGRAATRFGFQFEGRFRKHMVINGKNRDTLWFSMLDDEWPEIKASFEQWLDESNFDENGTQRRRLESFRH
jgi:RimJ/RimL family protein N-acetyltransferase